MPYQPATSPARRIESDARDQVEGVTGSDIGRIRPDARQDIATKCWPRVMAGVVPK
jgi:hypothetical protein